MQIMLQTRSFLKALSRDFYSFYIKMTGSPTKGMYARTTSIPNMDLSKEDPQELMNLSQKEWEGHRFLLGNVCNPLSETGGGRAY